MRVDDRIKNGVVYLAGRTVPGDETTEVNMGSGVIMSCDHRGLMFLYIATAEHVVRELAPFAEVVARMNDSAGNGHVVLLPHPEREAALWERHADSSVDLAVTQFFLPARLDGITHAPITTIIRDEQFGADGIGIGDEVFVVGLFHYVAGDGSNSPIVRVGNIAMLPTQLVSLRDYGNAEVYLIEARSIGGLSGSPVWVRESVRLTPKGSSENRFAIGNFYFLGLLHGVWYIDPASLHATSPPLISDADRGLNAGISVVVPAKKIRDILQGETFTKIREGAFAARQASQPLPTPTAAEIPFNPAVAALFQVPKSAVDDAESARRKRPRAKP